jgi:hypothetical protein
MIFTLVPPQDGHQQQVPSANIWMVLLLVTFAMTHLLFQHCFVILCHRVHMRYTARQASYPMGNGDYIREVQAAVA